MREAHRRRPHSAPVYLAALLILGLAGTAYPAPQKTPKPKPADLVASHLEALGPAEARLARKNTVARGRCTLRVLAGTERMLEGEALLLSEAANLLASLRFNVSDYPAEEFSFDGKEVYVGQLNPGQRSRVGQFLHQYHTIVREGLLGGVVSNAWPLLDLQARRPKLSYEGLKTVYDRRLHELSYSMRRGSRDMRIYLYLDPETSLHVGTLYRLTIPDAPDMTPSRTNTGADRAADSARNLPTRYTLEERFGEFQQVAGLMLPRRWKLRLTTEGPGAAVGLFEAATRDLSIIEWDVEFDTIEFNADIDPARFILHRK